MAESRCCPICEREHTVGKGWAFCPANPKQRLPDPDVEALQEYCAGVHSVQEREWAFWLHWTLNGIHEYPVFEAARLTLPTVMARLLDARADPNLRPPHHLCCVPDLRICDQSTPLHQVLNRLEQKQWFSHDGMSGIPAAVPDCVKVLVQHKADLNLTDAWGRTPLHMVLQHRRGVIRHSTAESRRVLKWAEECVEIMGAAAMATMPSRDAEYAAAPDFPWCHYCMRGLPLLHALPWNRTFGDGSRWQRGCDACHWKGYVFWCAQCDAWRPVVADSEAADKTCPACLVLARPSRHFCQSCGNVYMRCQCSTEDGGQPKTVRKTLDTRRYPACRNSHCGKQRSEEEGPWNEGSTVHYYCSDACRYPRCIGHGQNTCAARRPLLHGVRLRFDQEPRWRCPGCEERTRPLSCEAQDCEAAGPQPVDAFDPKHVENWRKGTCKLTCMACQRARRYPVCQNIDCGKQRAQEEGPWNQGSTVHYYCSDTCRYPRCVGHGQKKCAARRPLLHGVRLRYDQDPRWRCPACEELTLDLVCDAGCGETKPADDFDARHVKNWRWGNCQLKCKVCPRGEEYCSRCKARFPKTHFHKKDLNNAQQRRKKNPGKPVTLQCRQ